MIFNPKQLHDITDGDPDVDQEICNLYIETAQSYLTRLHSCLDDETEWSKTVHALKGASLNFGAIQIGELAAGLEKTAPSAEAITRLGNHFRELCHHLEASYPEICPGSSEYRRAPNASFDKGV